jgi:hypothetical protein
MKPENTQLIRSLEIERNGDWDGAHRIVQEVDSHEAARIHAYLHRVEGDLGNAQYWYSRVGEAVPTCPLDEEWQELFDRFSG